MAAVARGGPGSPAPGSPSVRKPVGPSAGEPGKTGKKRKAAQRVPGPAKCRGVEPSVEPAKPAKPAKAGRNAADYTAWTLEMQEALEAAQDDSRLPETNKTYQQVFSKFVEVRRRATTRRGLGWGAAGWALDRTSIVPHPSSLPTRPSAPRLRVLLPQGIGADIGISFQWGEPLTVQSAVLLLAELKRRLELKRGEPNALRMVGPATVGSANAKKACMMPHACFCACITPFLPPTRRASPNSRRLAQRWRRSSRSPSSARGRRRSRP